VLFRSPKNTISDGNRYRARRDRMSYLVFISLVMIVLFWGLLRKQQKQAGIRGWVRDQDLDGNGKRLYRDKQIGVVCKPDVVERNRVIEYKSATVDKQPRWVDILQLALQMKATGSQQAELRYAQNKRFSFDQNSREIRSAMKNAVNIVKKMKWHLLAGIAPKATPSQKRCAMCTFRVECTEAVQ
jgi:hypothetical protein